jgi:hypothetical protein
MPLPLLPQCPTGHGAVLAVLLEREEPVEAGASFYCADCERLVNVYVSVIDWK